MTAGEALCWDLVSWRWESARGANRRTRAQDDLLSCCLLFGVAVLERVQWPGVQRWVANVIACPFRVAPTFVQVEFSWLAEQVELLRRQSSHAGGLPQGSPRRRSLPYGRAFSLDIQSNSKAAQRHPPTAPAAETPSEQQPSELVMQLSLRVAVDDSLADVHWAPHNMSSAHKQVATAKAGSSQGGCKLDAKDRVVAPCQCRRT